MRALVVSTTTEEVELASDALWSLGVVAIEERVVPGGVYALLEGYDGLSFVTPPSAMPAVAVTTLNVDPGKKTS